MRWWKKRLFKKSSLLTPDEVFLDSTNIPGYSKERFEGILEKPLAKSAFYSFAILLLLFGVFMIGRAMWLQIVRGEELTKRAENNFIERNYINPPRGIIYDRNRVPIVFNTAVTNENGDIEYQREVRHAYAYSHVVGFTGDISEEDIARGADIPGIEETGKSGLEYQYDKLLRGVPGRVDQEQDAKGDVIAKGLVIQALEGEDIKTTLDANMQEALWGYIESTMRERGFRGGAGIVFNIKDGSILSLVSVPSYDINLFTRGLTSEDAERIFTDRNAPLFNRAVSGAYAPGSIIKPFLALAALEENIIDPNQNIYSSGEITIPNPYDPELFSTFLDWKAHGYVDMRRAIAVSSNVYFFTIGGGHEDIAGLGIRRMKDWLSRFGLNSPTDIDLGGEASGFLPDPDWKENNYPQNPTWRLGDTYNASIGQGFIVTTPIEIARGLAAIARGGELITPHLLEGGEKRITETVALNPENLKVVIDGMKGSAGSEGTASGISWVPYNIAAKTGTAEFGQKDKVHSWFMSFTPVEDPEIGIVIFMESAPRKNLVGATSVASELFTWIIEHGGIEALVD
ncbi:MAG: penicillin-binding transpeptidase domain-containing protein [bacterium]|nr:penicillin-binding transpeptidase domain-containing protein [bacterium]